MFTDGTVKYKFKGWRLDADSSNHIYSIYEETGFTPQGLLGGETTKEVNFIAEYDIEYVKGLTIEAALPEGKVIQGLSNVGDKFTIDYKISKNDGIHKLVLIPQFDDEKFKLNSITPVNTTGLGTGTVSGSAISFDTDTLYSATGDKIVSVEYEVISKTVGEYEFGFVFHYATDTLNGITFTGRSYAYLNPEVATVKLKPSQEVKITFDSSKIKTRILTDAAITIASNQSVPYTGNSVTIAHAGETGDLSFTYSGYAKQNDCIQDKAEFTFKWYDEDGNLLDESPKNAGTYYVGVSASASDYYGAVDEVKESFTIVPYETTLTNPTTKLTYTGSSLTVSFTPTSPDDAGDQLTQDDFTVTYYKKEGSTVDTSNPLTAVTELGTYVFVATLKPGHENYTYDNSREYEFVVVRPAPASGVGYIIDYESETIRPLEGYDVSTGSGDDFDSGILSGESVIDFSETYFVRMAGDEDNLPSDETSVVFTRPAAPVEASFTVSSETLENKKDGTFSGITETMEYSLDNGLTWVSGPATLTGLSDETVKVRYKATSTEFKSEEFTYTFTPSTEKLTVVAGGVTQAAVAYGEKIEKPADPQKEGYTFSGWYLDEECTEAWNFDADTVTENITLYPKWIEKNTETGSIGGNVSEDGVKVPGAIVELFMGNTKVAATVTDNNGNYRFDLVEKGTYNIVITKDGKTKTVLVTVDSADSYTKDVELPVSSVSSIVEIQPLDIDGVKSDVSKTVVGGLDVIAESRIPSGSEKIRIKLKVVPKKEEDVENAAEIKRLAGGGKKVEFLDVSLWEQIDDNEPQNIGGNNTRLLTIVIPFDFSNVEVSSMMVLRNHDGETTKILTDPNEYGEYFEVDVNNGSVILHAMKFSEYAIAYEMVHEHEWDTDYTVDIDPTCTQSGSKSIHCRTCSEVKDVTSIPATGHHFGEWTTVVPATCYSTGTQKRVCSECDHYETRNLNTNGHSFGEWQIVIAPTCEEKGMKKRVCSSCGRVETMEMDPTGHEWESDYKVDIEPTCTQDGSKSIHCKSCSSIKESVVIPHLDHKWGNETIVNEATKTEDGEKTCTCERCGEVKHEVIPKTGHDAKCIVHWFMIALLALYAILFTVFTLLKKRWLALITSLVCGVASFILAFFGACTVCTTFTVVNLAVIVAGILFTTLRKNASDDDEKKTAQQG